MIDDGTWRLKARFVARGYEDKEKDRVSSDSPVASSAAQRLVIMTSGEQVVRFLALHVDDAIGGGTEEFHGVMAKIGETLAMGSHETSNFRYKGLRVSTVFKNEQTVFEIIVDGDDYLASCRTKDMPRGEDTDLFPPQSMTDYRSVVGTIGYASSEFRPDLAWEMSSFLASL
jgi:hypothetical protein